MATASTLQHTSGQSSQLPSFMTSKEFAVNMFLVAVAILSIPFVYHAFMSGLDYVVDGAGEHGAFNRADDSRFPIALYLLAIHMMMGASMNILSPFQVYLGRTQKSKILHRWIGFSTIAIAFFGATAGTLYFSMAPDTNAGDREHFLIFQAGTIYGVVMFYVTYKVVQTLMTRNYSAHKEWAIRLFMLAIGSWLFRVNIGVYATGNLVGLQHILPPGGFGVLNAFGFYMMPLAIYEGYLRLRRAGKFNNLPSYAPFVTACAGILFLLVGDVAYVMMSYMNAS